MLSQQVADTAASTIDVLLVVDAAAATQTNPPDLTNNVYMIDTNKFMGSLQEGQPELVTTVANGQNIVWSVAPVDPASSVAIVGFNGQAIGQQISPAAQGTAWGSDWASQANMPPNSSGTTFQYSIVLQFEGPNGITLGFDPFLMTK